MGTVDTGSIVQAAKLKHAIKACTKCDLSAKEGVTPVPFRGDVPAEVVFIGEAPGRVENKEGLPFVGPSGKLLMKALGTAKVLDHRVMFANTASCFPNRAPNEREVRACHGNVVAQITLARPSLVVLLGGNALSGWWKDLRIGDARGRYWWMPEEVTDFVPVVATSTWHPAAVLRNRELYGEFLRDLVTVGRALRKTVYHVDQPPTCVLCGEWDGDEVWVAAGDRGLGIDVSEVTGAFGIPFCRKHWDYRVKVLGAALGVTKGEVGKKPRKATKKAKEEAMGGGLFDG